MQKTLDRTHKFFSVEEVLLDLSTNESAEKAFHKISGDSYARGELSMLIWLADSKSLNFRAIELLKWRMIMLMDYLDGKLDYELLSPIPIFKD